MSTSVKPNARSDGSTVGSRGAGASTPARRRRPVSVSTPGRILTAIALAGVVYFLIWPLVMLGVGSLRTTPLGDGAVWTLDGYKRAFSDSLTYLRLRNTVLYGSVTAVVSVVIATYFATVATRFDTRLRAFITPMMILLAITPRLFFSLAWGMLGTPASGLIGRMFIALGVDIELDVFTWPGLLFVSCIKMVGYAYILLLGPISRVDRSLEDAAIMSGATRVKAYLGITVPTLAPAFIATVILTFILSVQVFDIPAVIGMPAGIMTLSLHVNDYLVGSVRPDYVAATALSLVFVIMIFLLLLIQRRMLGRRSFSTVTGRSAAHSPWRPRAGVRAVINLTVVVFFLVAIFAPLVQIVMGSLQAYFGVYGNWTVRHFAAVLADPGMVKTVVVTLMIAVFGGLVTTAAAFGMAYAKQRATSPAVRSIVGVGSWVPLLAPGIVLSIALLWAYLSTPFVRDLFGTPWLLLFALSVASIPIAIRALEGVVAQVSPSLEDAARMSGASYARAIADVTARISGRSLLGAWLLVGLVMSGLLDVPLLLKGTGNETVPTAAYAMYWDGNIAGAAALYCTYMLAVVAVIVIGLIVAATVVKLLKRSAARELGQLVEARGNARHEGAIS